MLVSFGAALVVFVVVSFGVLLTWKVLRSPQWMTSIMAWTIAWPLLLLVKVVGIPYPGKGGLFLAVVSGTATDIAVLSGLIYAGYFCLNECRTQYLLRRHQFPSDVCAESTAPMLTRL